MILINFILIILINIIIYLFIQFNKIKSNINKDVPKHTHLPIVNTNVPPVINNGITEEQVNGITEEQVNDLIDTRISNLNLDKIQYSEDMFINSVSATELGYELSLTGDKIIFNKETAFNNPARFNQYTELNNATAIQTNDLNIKAFENMISPFYVKFSELKQGVYKSYDSEINKMKENGWYLCNGTAHIDPDYNGTFPPPHSLFQAGLLKRKTPDLRGRFILPGGVGVNPNIGVNTSYYQHWAQEGGTYSTTLGVENLPDHSHVLTGERGGSKEVGNNWTYGDSTFRTTESNSEFIGTPFSNIPPYFVLAYFIYWPKPWTWSYDCNPSDPEHLCDF